MEVWGWAQITHLLSKKVSSSSCTPLQDGSEWSPARSFAAAILSNQWFERFIGCLIICSVATMVVDANNSTKCITTKCASHELESSTYTLNLVFLLIFTIELLLRIYVERLRCLTISWDVIDGLCVISGYVDLLLSDVAPDFPNLQLFRIFRVVRMLRSARLLHAFPELYAYVRGFAAALRAMLWGVGVVAFVLLLVSIISVELVHPRSAKLFEEGHPCANIFVSVQDAILYFFQTSIAGDSWGECAVPLTKEYWWPFLVFAGNYMVVQLGLLNMILSVIVESAAAAREADLEDKAAQAQKDREESTRRLLKIIQDIDLDKNGHISSDELLAGYDDEKGEMKNVIASLHIDRDELGRLFRCLDADHTGTLEYLEFVRQIQKAHSSDLRVQLMLLKMEMQEVSHKLQRQLDAFRSLQETVSDKHGRLVSAPSAELWIRDSVTHGDSKPPAASSFCFSRDQLVERVLLDMAPLCSDTKPETSMENNADDFMRASELQLASMANSSATLRL